MEHAMKQRGRAFGIALAVLAILVIGGCVAWGYQLKDGLGVTGMNNGVSWGLYITLFMFFVGLSAGGLIVASAASVFHVAAYKRVAVPAIILSTVCIVAAGLFICVDLGGVFRVYNMLIHPNFTSPLVWDEFVIGIYLLINLVYLYVMTRPQPNQRTIAIVSRFALPVAILVHSVTAWIFGLQVARVGWNSAIMAPLFVVSALDSGLALLLIVLLALRKFGYPTIDKALAKNLAGLLATCVAIDGFLVFCEVITMLYSGDGPERTILNELVSGRIAPFFWGEVLLGVVIPFSILAFERNRERTSLIVVSSVFVLVGVFFKRIWLLFPSLIHFNVSGAPGVTIGNAHLSVDGMWEQVGAYWPTGVEVAIIVGVLALATAVFVLLAKRLVKPAPEAN
jgi:molybdopterin-containing oxidoreductase family membrane subunit